MRCNSLLTWSAVLTVFAASTMPVGLAAREHHRYRLIDMRTFGGPQSYTYGEAAQSLNGGGTAVGQADTSVLDPNYPNVNPLVDLFPDPFIQHAFKWQKGARIDLGALRGVNSSVADWVNDWGVAVGTSTTGSLDPITGFPAANAVVWIDGYIVNLGTLDGGYESLATAINDRGQITGVSSNATLDSNSLFGLGTQTRAFLWEDGAMRDLGTLGGTDAAALLINDRGQIAGVSYTDSLAIAPFVWRKGLMTDLGSFGGTFGGPQWLNSRGQIVGQSNLSGDQTFHPFRWQDGVLTDLGTLGGSDGNALWINDAGVIVGWATNQNDQAVLAFLWKHGVMTSLGTLNSDPCSIAWAINGKGEVVGSSSADCDFSGGSTTEHAFLWDDGEMIDLNIFVPSSSHLTLVEPHYINDRGEITGNAVLPDGSLRAFLLIPCAAAQSEADDCRDAGNVATESRTPGTKVGIQTLASPLPRESMSEILARLAHRGRVPMLNGVSGRPADKTGGEASLP